MLNDNCPFNLWTVIVAAATISVHGGQLSLMDSYRCYNAYWCVFLLSQILYYIILVALKKGLFCTTVRPIDLE